MREVLSALFEGLTAGLGLPVDKVKEFAILLVIGAAAFLLAWIAVGRMYGSRIIRTRAAGSVAHWVIRLAVFVGLWAYFYGLIWAIRLIQRHWVTAVCIAAAVIVSIVVIIICRHIRRKKGGAANA